MKFIWSFVKDTFNNFSTMYSDKITNLIIRIVLALVVILVGIMLVKVVKKLINRALKKFKLQNNSLSYVVSVIGVLLYIVLAVFVAAIFGLDATSIVALLGSAGVTIGLAIQGSLSNMAGGVLILLLQPFKVNDYIIENTGHNEGTVTEIGLFYTKLQTLDDKTVILPNGSLANTSLTNVTHTPYRLIEFSFEIGYESDLKLAKEIVEKQMKKDASTIDKKNFEVYVNNLLADGVEIGGRCYVKNSDYRAARARIIEAVKLDFDKNKIEIPYPQVVVHKA